jgi:hypothetical protein
MALLSPNLPYGLRDVKLAPLTGLDVVGSSVDLPNARTLSFTENEDFEELRGDDVVVATRGKGPTVSWDLESGGISLTAYAIMAGGVATTTGVTPNAVTTYTKLNTDARPKFQIEGQAMSESGGDFHCKIFVCKANDSLAGTLADGTFWLTSASGSGIGSQAATNLAKVYEFKSNETAVANT